MTISRVGVQVPFSDQCSRLRLVIVNRLELGDQRQIRMPSIARRVSVVVFDRIEVVKRNGGIGIQ